MNFGTILIYVISFFGLFTSALFLLTFYDKDNKKYMKAKLPKVLPTVSFVIPAWNSEKGVVKSINSVLNLDYPKNKIEIIVVNDGSTDNTLEAASKFKKQGVKVYSIPYSGKGAALNKGIKHAKGEFIANLDADSFLNKDALKKMIGFFQNPEVMAVTPSIKAWNPKTIAQKIQVLEFLSSSIVKKVFSYWGAMPIATGACTMFRREFFSKHGLYLEDSLAEDGEISLRIAKHGYRIENAMDTAVYTHGMKSFKSLAYQRLRWFRGLLDCLVMHRSLFKPSKGNIATLVLPILLTSIVLTVVGASYIAFNFAMDSWKFLMNLSLTGFDLIDLFNWKFDFFNINIGATMFLPLVMLAISAFIILVCKKHAKEKQSIVQPYAYFLVTYWFIASFSWIRAVYYKLFEKKIKWGNRWL